MKQKFLYIIAITLYPLFSQGMSSTFFKPATYTPKIRFANDAFFTINPIYSHASSKNSYDINGEKTYLGQWNKPETLLNSFNDSTLDATDTTSAGKAYVDGTSIVHEAALIITKNIKKGLFVDVQVFQQYLTIKNLSLVPLNSKSEPFASEENLISEDPALAAYVTEFKTVHPSFQSKATQTYFFNQTFLFAGYTTSWNHFSRIDFIDVTCKLGLALNLNKTKNSSIFDLPLHKNNGFCAEISGAIGVLNWINIGANVSAKIYAPTQQSIGLNTNAIDNSFLKPHKSQAVLKQQPFFYGNIYIEGDHIEGGLSILLGYAFAAQNKTKIISLDSAMSESYNNPQSRYDGWSSGTLLFEVEYDFATEKRKNVPTLKLSFYRPIHGRKVFKSAAQGTSCCLQFSHKF